MKWVGIAAGALALLGIGGVLLYGGAKLIEGIKDAFSGLADGARRALALPGEALDYLKQSHELARNPDQLERDVVTGERMGGYLGVLASQTTRENREAVAKQRATEAPATTIKRLQEQRALLEATGQPHIVDLEAGEKLTLDDVKRRLAALGVKS